MPLALGDRQAIGVRPDAAREDRVAVDDQVLRRDRRGDVRAGCLDEIHGLGRGDMLEHDLQRREVAHQRRSTRSMNTASRSKTSTSGSVTSPWTQQRHADPLHRLQRRVRCCAMSVTPCAELVVACAGIELGRDPDAVLEAARELGRVGVVGQVAGHQRREAGSPDRRDDPLAIGRGRRRRWSPAARGSASRSPARTGAPCTARPPAASSPSRKWTCQSSGRRMVSVCDATPRSLTESHGRHHPHRPRRRPPLRRRRARLPAGAGHQRLSRRPLPVWTGLLTPQGKCLFDFIVWADGDDLLLDCEAERGRRSRSSGWRSTACAARSRSSATTALAVHWSPDGGRACRPASASARHALARARRRSRRGLARASPPPRRHRRPRRARRHPLARMQCGRAERRQLHQGLLRRPGEYRADELAAEGQSPAVRGRGRRRPSARAIEYPELGLAVVHRRASMRSRTTRSSPNGWKARSLSRARRRRAPGRFPCRAPSAAPRRSENLRREAGRARSYARRSGCRRRAASSAPAAPACRVSSILLLSIPTSAAPCSTSQSAASAVRNGWPSP